MKVIHSKIQNGKKLQSYKLLYDIVNKNSSKLLELWQLYQTGGDKIACITLTKSLNITINNMNSKNVLDNISFIDNSKKHESNI